VTRELSRLPEDGYTEVYQIEADFEAKVEAESDRMDASVSRRPTDSRDQARRAGSYVARQFGNDVKWAKLNEAIWKIIESRRDHAFHLSDLPSAAESVSCDSNDLLAVLGLLSSSTARFLRMEYRSGPDGEIKISASDFARKLADWWRKGSMSDEEWAAWASSTKVKWSRIDE
jgi:hypothetical protein